MFIIIISLIPSMQSPPKTEDHNSDLSSQRLDLSEQKQITSQEIHSAHQTFSNLIQLFQTKKPRLKLDDLQEIYNIDIYHINALDIESVKLYYEEVMTRYKCSKAKRNWVESELRVFVWMLFNLAEMRKKPVDSFDGEDWELLASSFVGKSVEDVKFEWLLLTKSSTTSVPWAEEEDEMLESLMNQPQYNNKWIDIAKVLYQHSKSVKNFRKPKQCRQRWKNYLNPTIQKGEWTLDEDKKMFECVRKYGKKWSNIARELGTRTEHAVKNRYKSLLKKFKKDHSIRQKPKCTKGLHNKELEQIDAILTLLEGRISDREGIINQPPPKEKQEEIITREEIPYDRFYPISPRSAWKYYDKSMPPVLSIIQSPRIISPKLNSPGFRYPIGTFGTWEEEANKLFYS